MVLPQYWQITPLAVCAVVAGIAYEVGRRRLAKRQTAAHRRARWHRALAFYAGLGPALFGICLFGLWVRRQGPAFPTEFGIAIVFQHPGVGAAGPVQ